MGSGEVPDGSRGGPKGGPGERLDPRDAKGPYNLSFWRAPGGSPGSLFGPGGRHVRVKVEKKGFQEGVTKRIYKNMKKVPERRSWEGPKSSENH